MAVETTTTESMSSIGVARIHAERRRQVEAEGWTPEHDAQHSGEELALAAAVYAWPSPRPLEVKKAWPWDRSWWKPTTPEMDPVNCGCRSVGECRHFSVTDEAKRKARMRDLEKAGALIAAEIDRLAALSKLEVQP